MIKRNSEEDTGRPLEYQAWDNPILFPILFVLTIIMLGIGGIALLFL